VVVPAGAQIGMDHDEDRRRGFTVSESGVVALAKNQLVIP
jgi:glucose-1-phosphate adenylyltransferase